MSLLLIHPPVVKPCEPPAGIAKLYAALNYHGIKAQLLDANIEGQRFLLNQPVSPTDTWTTRAVNHREENLKALTSRESYQNIDRYKRSVHELNRLLERAGVETGVRLALADYQDQHLSPVRSADLVSAAEQPEKNVFYPYYQDRLKNIIEQEKPSLVGFSLNYLSQALCTFAMMGFMKQHWPDLKIVLGGGLVTSWMRRPEWKNPFAGLVDHLVAGPGEKHLIGLMGGTQRGTVDCPPDYFALPLDDYLAPGLILPYSASSGCYWNKCSFCPERAERNPYRPVADAQVLKELRHLVESTQPVLIHLVDNAIRPSLLKALGSHARKTPWYGFVRVTPELTDLDYCRALKQSGCVMLKLGIESGDQEVLDRLGKGVAIAMAAQALQTLKRASIATYVYLLLGTPPENEASARKTLDFVVANHEAMDFLNLAIFNLPVHGPEADLVQTKKFYEGDLCLYTDFEHPQG